MKTTLRNVMAGLIIAVPAISSAAVISTDRAGFLAAIAGEIVGGDSFDSYLAGTILGMTPDVTFAASNGLPLVVNLFATTTFPNGLGSTSVGFFQTTETATFSFHTPITAFAIDINTAANADGAFTATLNTGQTAASNFDPFPGFSTGQFLGFFSDSPFTEVTLGTLTGHVYTLDTLLYLAQPATPAPEPVSLFLLGIGLAGFRLSRRSYD